MHRTRGSWSWEEDPFADLPPWVLQVVFEEEKNKQKKYFQGSPKPEVKV